MATAERTPAQKAAEANLVPFVAGGDNPHRAPGRGRPSLLHDEDKIDAFAHALAEGCTNADLMAMFSVSERSVRVYKRDARVKAKLSKYIEDRILRISRKVDSQVEAYLEIVRNDDDLTTKDKVELLLKIRKEFLGGAFRLAAEGGKLEPGQINDALEELEGDPAFAAELRELFERQKD